MKQGLEILSAVHKYRAIAGSEKAATSKRFGVLTCVMAVLFAGLSALIPVALRLFDAEGFLTLIGAIILLVIGAGGMLVLLVRMILYLTFQFRLNRTAIGFVALGALLASLAAACCIILLTF